MPRSTDIIPVVLLAYARPAHLRRVLACLRTERVPVIQAFADGAKGAADADQVAEVRRLLREIDWCEVKLTERPENLGLGRNVLTAVGETARHHEAFVVWEDDLVCVPGTYAWLCAALRHYATDTRVLSVSAWTHPSITPPDVIDVPYFDERAECWVWGGYARSWAGMERDAQEKLTAIRAAGRNPAAHGADLIRMAQMEHRRNIWAVRWLCHHLEVEGLCLRPPWSMVDHIGADELATHAARADRWSHPALRSVPPLPAAWPPAVANPACRDLWQKASPAESPWTRLRAKVWSAQRRMRQQGHAVLRALLPEALRRRLRPWWSWRWFRGDYATWAAARAASSGYAVDAILNRVLTATLAVRAGQAAFERDGVLFQTAEADTPLLDAVKEIRRTHGGGLRVLDFGGSLGSTYWRLRPHLPADAIRTWDVVEQSGFVEAGRQHLAGEVVRFFHTVVEAEPAGPHDLLLCSGTLQYLEHPAAVLAGWRELNIPYLLLNNLPLHASGPTRLRVQHVPPAIYPASYPVRFFNRAEFRGWLEPDFEIIREFASEAVWPVDLEMYPSTGLLLRKRTA